MRGSKCFRRSHGSRPRGRTGVQIARLAPLARDDLEAVMSNAFHGNNELALHVPDPATAAEFYVNVLGCAEASRSSDCIEVTSGALRLFLLRDPAPTHDVVVPSFDVPNREEALARLQAAGCTLV